MPDYKQHSVMRPDSISADALTVHLQVLKEDARVKEALGINMREEGEIRSWLDLWTAVGGSRETNPDGTTYLFVEEAGINEAMIAILCEWVDTNPLLLPYVSVDAAETCSKMIPGGFGGSAIFIAHSPGEVRQMALEQAGNLTDTEKASEYSVEGLWEIADTREDPQS